MYYSVTIPMGRQCEVTLSFADPSFLLITFAFNLITCDSKQINTFNIPKYSPNGRVDIF
jgi:hypothetical protein